MSVEKYLKPEVINQIKRLDLRAQFVVRGFLQGLHSSPWHGFSVEFSEHRKYSYGDDPKDIDWSLYARTDKYYVKKFEAETNMTAMLVVDCSASMGYTYRQELNKFDYVVCLAAALAYLMILQQDPVGLITFRQSITSSLPPRSKRSHLGNLLSVLANLETAGTTNLAHSLRQLAAMLRHRNLVIVFTDLLEETDPAFQSLVRLRHGGHDVILFHILDEAEVSFPFTGMCQMEDPESETRIKVDANAWRAEYREKIVAFRDDLAARSAKAGIDYVPLDTSMQFDKALIEYLHSRQSRF